LLTQLAGRGINHLMVEAGAGLNGALVRAGLVDEIVLYLAPSLAGDAARGLFAWPALQDLSDKPLLNISDVRMVGADLRLQLSLRQVLSASDQV
jgi:diaminohydroxyphosphoribosylaminopyrimidine deaminase/5-amino-6-(5-phosphoribosylamino)uracil reductase